MPVNGAAERTAPPPEVVPGGDWIPFTVTHLMDSRHI